ncbi:MAG: hypothetical protein M1837_001424 [Sclerophora amabilis]|nr:MAG: hypothetical protein M1837_001424 [Sclerophora amabilis]
MAFSLALNPSSGPLLCRTCARRISRKQLCLSLRTFTSSPAHRKHGAVSSFAPTSSPELDSIFSDFRDKVFIPAHLSQQHRDIIYKGRNHHLLSSGEPVTVEIGDEKIQLQPIDPTKDEPSTRREFTRMLALMKEPADWDNLPAFLEELHNAKRKLSEAHMEKMVRKASEAGRQDVVLNCARKVEKTGMALKNVTLVCEVLWGIRAKAIRADWDEETTAKALKQAEQVIDMLEDVDHCGGARRNVGDPRLQPEIIGALLELATARAVKHQGGQDLDGRVRTYTDRLMARWENPRMVAEIDTLDAANLRLVTLVPIWNGLSQARRFFDDGSTQAVWLKGHWEILDGLIAGALNMVEKAGPRKRPLRGVLCYDEIAA